MRFILAFIMMAMTLPAAAQEDEQGFKQPSAESEQYHQRIIKRTTPPYGLEKVQKLIRTIRFDDQSGNVEEGEGKQALTPKQWESLSLREKFTYCMIQGEVFMQICDAFPPVEDEHLKISSRLANDYSETKFSARQLKWLKANKDSVLALIKESAGRAGYLGLNYKETILELNGVSMIPQLIEWYGKFKRDLDILTVLNLLMKENKYAPFVQSSGYKKLYGGDDTYFTFLNYNQANEELIIKRATEFHQSIR